jgi:hypothetical protein
LVAGTSEYIHAARTSANASEPCRVNVSSFRAVGRKNHAKLMKAPLAATVLTVAYGGRRTRPNSARMASRKVPGSDTTSASGTGQAISRVPAKADASQIRKLARLVRHAGSAGSR